VNSEKVTFMDKARWLGMMVDGILVNGVMAKCTVRVKRFVPTVPCDMMANGLGDNRFGRPMILGEDDKRRPNREWKLVKKKERRQTDKRYSKETEERDMPSIPCLVQDEQSFSFFE
jgi:hypothetical protein